MQEFFHLENRAVIEITGSQTKQFLQGLITNDVSKIAEGEFMYAFMLTPQGRFLYDFFITEKRDKLLIDCQKSKVEDIIKKLNMYKLRAQVTILPTELQVYAAFSRIDQGFSADPRNDKMGFRSLRASLSDSQPAPFHHYELKRIDLLIPDADIDFIPERSFPLEYGANELNAIDYQKGCYVGQELTARTHHRGTIRKKICKLEFTGEAPEKGVEITSHAGHKVGIILGSSGTVGLGLINMDDFRAHQPVHGMKVFADAVT